MAWFAALSVGGAVAIGLGAMTGQARFQLLALAAAALLALTGLYAVAPELTLLGFVVVRPLVDAYVYISFGGHSLGEFWGAALIAVCLIYLLSRSEVHWSAVPLLLIAAYVCLTFVRPEFSVALSNGLKLASWLLLLIAVGHIAQNRAGQVAVLRSILACAVMLVLVIALVIAQGRYGAAYYGFSDVSTGYSSPHVFASLAVLLLPAVFAAIILGVKTWAVILLAVCLCVGVMESFVRTTYLALLPVLAAYLLVALRESALRIRLSAAGILASLGVAIYYLRAEVVTRLTDLPLIGSLLGGSVSPSPGGGSGRTVFWKDLFVSGTDNVLHILVGRGAGASSQLLARVYGNAIWSHNDFLEFFYTGGVLLTGAYLVFLAWVVIIIVRLYRDQRQSQAVHTFAALLAGGFLAYLILSVANGMALFAGSVVMGVLVGFAQGLGRTPGNTALDRPQIGRRNPETVSAL
jgi:hypothetical protein